MKTYATIPFLLVLVFLHVQSIAQTLDPDLLSVYEPVPEKVTPGEYTDPPSDAIILFDGKDLNEWMKQDGSRAGWAIADGYMTVVPKSGAIKTRQKFGDIQLHIEWRAPAEIEGEGQGRGNSGIFLMERYEVQVLDSYDNETYVNGQAGSIYKQSIPLVNASKKPGEWQTYDIIFMAPEFTDKGDLKMPARVTVLHNGVLIQNNFEIKGHTTHNTLPKYEPHGDASIVLQDHSDLVSYRNIWIREL
jgi:hypothetical protein